MQSWSFKLPTKRMKLSTTLRLLFSLGLHFATKFSSDKIFRVMQWWPYWCLILKKAIFTLFVSFIWSFGWKSFDVLSFPKRNLRSQTLSVKFISEIFHKVCKFLTPGKRNYWSNLKVLEWYKFAEKSTVRIQFSIWN